MLGVGSKCGLKVHMRNLGYPLPYKSDALRRLRNLTATLTACVFGKRHDIRNRISALKNTRGLLHCLEIL